MWLMATVLGSRDLEKETRKGRTLQNYIVGQRPSGTISQATYVIKNVLVATLNKVKKKRHVALISRIHFI